MSDDPLADAMPRSRIISSIGFPYMDMDDAISVARAMLAGGAVPMDRDQLAAAMSQVPSSGNFNMKLSAAKLFGLIDNPQGKYQLTPLGFEILDAARERAAKAQAFLNVPLYRRVYDTFKGRQLPPRPIGLEKALVDFGVSPRQKDKARHAFDRSARIAGFFSSSAEDRLVEPIIGPFPSTVRELEQQASPPVSIEVRPAASVTGSGVPPFMAWLLDALPEQGAEWDKGAQADWLQAVAQAFRVVFRSESKETIEVTVKKAGA